MTEDEPTGIDPADIIVVEDDQTAETPPAQPSQPEGKMGKTATERMMEALSQFNDFEQAKSAIPKLAQEIGCAKSLGYKVVKRLKRQGHFNKDGKPNVEPVEPTLKIREVEPEPIPEQPQPEEPQEPVIIDNQPQPSYAPQPSPAEQYGDADILNKITPIFERAVGRLFNRGLETISQGNKDILLDDQESRDTATLIPIALYRFTKMRLNTDQMIDATLGAHFGAIAVKVINAKLAERRKKIVEPPPPPPPQPKPEPTPAPQPQPQQEKPRDRPKTASFMEML